MLTKYIVTIVLRCMDFNHYALRFDFLCVACQLHVNKTGRKKVLLTHDQKKILSIIVQCIL